MKNLKSQGKISEVFASICGEGLNIGSMQLFIRLAACSSECRFCSSKNAPHPEGSFAMRPWPGPRIIRVTNPITPEKLLQKIDSVFPLNIFYSVSFVGGEPLCQQDFIMETAGLLRKKSVRLFADTQAPDVKRLAKMLPVIDDWSITLNHPGKTAMALRLKKHLCDLLEMVNPKNCYLRIILNSDDDPKEFINLFSQLNLDDFTLVIQPSSLAPARINDWDTGTILEWVKTFQPFFAQIRWIPQVHKLLRIP